MDTLSAGTLEVSHPVNNILIGGASLPVRGAEGRNSSNESRLDLKVALYHLCLGLFSCDMKKKFILSGATLQLWQRFLRGIREFHGQHHLMEVLHHRPRAQASFQRCQVPGVPRKVCLGNTLLFRKHKLFRKYDGLFSSVILHAYII